MIHADPSRKSVTAEEGRPAQRRLRRSCACESTGQSCERCGTSLNSEGRSVASLVARNLGSRTPARAMDDAASESQANLIGHRVGAATDNAHGLGPGADFSSVRIHSDAAADAAARSVGASAFTYGSDIYFASGQYDVSSREGRALLGHELTHVAQQRAAPASPVVQKQEKSWSERASAWYDEKKWAAYRALIAAAKKQKNQVVGYLRTKVPGLPGWAQGPAGTMIDVLDFVIDMWVALLLAVIGLTVGFVEGIAGLVTGLLKLVYGLVKLVADAILAVFDKGEAFKSDLDFLANALHNFGPAVKKMVEAWLEKYKKATLEEQVLMGAELVGQIEALIATFAVAGTKAGQAGSIAIPTALKVESKALIIGASKAGEAIAVQVPTKVAVAAATQVSAKPLAQAGVLMAQATAVGSGGPGGTSGSGGGSGSPASAQPQGKTSPAAKGGGSAAKGPPVEIDPATGVPRQIHVPGGVTVGPAYATFEEAFAAKAHEGAHITENILLAKDGKQLAHWWEVSESLAKKGVKGVGRLGDTEQKALTRVRLEPGMTLEIRGQHVPCTVPGGCDVAMQIVAEESGGQIVYRTTANTVAEYPKPDF